MKTNSDTPPALYLGLDVHKEQTVAAIADPSPRGEVRSGGAFKTCQPALEKFLRKLAKSHGIPLSRLCVCYEAGGCGFWMARRLRQLGVPCLVVAPSLIPTRSGDRVKTDKKDAVKLARLLRAGELTPVHLPDEVDETIRDLCRARTDAIDDLRRSKTRLLGFLRRNGYHYQGKTHWTEAHKRYLRDLNAFYLEVLKVMDAIKAAHGEAAPLSIFPAAPVSTMVKLGQARQPKADLDWIIYDEVKELGGFVEAIRIGNRSGD